MPKYFPVWSALGTRAASTVSFAPVAGKPPLDVILSQPCRILECLLDIRTLQVRIAGENLLGRRAVGDLADDDQNRHTHTTNAGPAAQDVLVEGDAVKHSSCSWQ